LFVIRRDFRRLALGFAQRSLLVPHSLFVLGSCARCPLSFSPVSPVVWFEGHWFSVKCGLICSSTTIYMAMFEFCLSCYLPAGALPKTTLKSDVGRRDIASVLDADRRFQRRRDMAQGKVKFFNSQKGFGFIQPNDGGPDVFVHVSAVERAGMSTLNEGQELTYDVVSERGKLAASNLQVA
jgi:cold shock protein